MALTFRRVILLVGWNRILVELRARLVWGGVTVVRLPSPGHRAWILAPPFSTPPGLGHPSIETEVPGRNGSPTAPRRIF